jgi:hypothetical protein
MNQTSQQQKKIREREFFDRVQPAINAWPRGKLDDNGEQPDLVVDAPEGKYGVEITEVVRPATRAEVEAKRQICAKASRKYVAQTNIMGLGVHVNFRLNIHPTKADIDSASNELLQIVLCHFPNPDTTLSRRDLRHGIEFKSRWFDIVWLHFHPKIKRSLWQASDAWWVPSLTATIIRAEIARKESKLENYRKRAPKIWLLIIVDGFDGASAWSVADDVYTQEYVTSFDGVVVLEDALRKVTTLKLAAP